MRLTDSANTSGQIIPNLCHSGKLGDVIYGLTVARAMGQVNFFLNCTNSSFMSPEDGLSLLPLIKAQPYIRSADIWNGEPIDFDLDTFRRYGDSLNLADSHLTANGISSSMRDQPWLTVEIATQYVLRPIIFSRTERYPGVSGFWEAMFEAFNAKAAFVGSPKEHLKFEQSFGTIPYIPCGSLLELAEVLAGAKLYVGNQSCPLAIAEGLKKPIIQEVCLETPNCIFARNLCYPVTMASQFKVVINEIALRQII